MESIVSEQHVHGKKTVKKSWFTYMHLVHVCDIKHTSKNLYLIHLWTCLRLHIWFSNVSSWFTLDPLLYIPMGLSPFLHFPPPWVRPIYYVSPLLPRLDPVPFTGILLAYVLSFESLLGHAFLYDLLDSVLVYFREHWLVYASVSSIRRPGDLLGVRLGIGILLQTDEGIIITSYSNYKTLHKFTHINCQAWLL